MDAADRVRKLAALAASDNEHEAHSAAMQACRLIREGKVRVIEGLQRAREDRRAPVAWDTWDTPPRPRTTPRGPFQRQRSVEGQTCEACGEFIDMGDAFSSATGYVLRLLISVDPPRQNLPIDAGNAALPRRSLAL